jgi:hypothetical protein
MAGLGAEADILSGMLSNIESQIEAEFLLTQGTLAKQETLLNAERQAKNSDKLRRKQKMLFIKAGVDLVGTPLLVLEETRSEAEAELEAANSRAASLFNVAQGRSAALRRGGRARLVGAEAKANSRIFEADVRESLAEFEKGQNKIFSAAETVSSFGAAAGNFTTTVSRGS